MKLNIFLLLCTLGCLVSIQAQDQYFPPNFGTWETISPSSLNWCQAELDNLHDFLEERDTKAFIILKDGRIAIEWYYGAFTQDSIWYWASAGKSLTATLIGIAQEEGLLSIEDATQDHLGQGWTNTTPEQEAQITIRHQLTMTTGLDDSNFSCTDPECLNYLVDPDTRWAYHNGPYTLLESVIESASGQSMNSFYNSRIGTKIGALGAYVPIGFNRVFFTKPRSMARFGLLIQSGGVWNETTVLGDVDYMNAMITPSQTINPSYGYLWWLNGQESYKLPGLQFAFEGPIIETAPDDLYAALGKNDQKIYIVPSQGLVVIRMGDDATNSPLAISDFDPLLWEKITALSCTTGIEDEFQNNQQITLFPNPVNDQIWVKSEEPIEQLFLYNLSGELLVQSSKNTLLVSTLPVGVYFVKIQIKNKPSVFKKLIRTRS